MHGRGGEEEAIMAPPAPSQAIALRKVNRRKIEKSEMS
jgi:hypothetical protein